MSRNPFRIHPAYSVILVVVVFLFLMFKRTPPPIVTPTERPSRIVTNTPAVDTTPAKHAQPTEYARPEDFVSPDSKVMTEGYRRAVTDQMERQGVDRTDAEAFTKALNDAQRDWERRR